VGLNYEDPKDQDSVSIVTFGYLDYTQVHGGVEGLNWYQNKGIDEWALVMEDVHYDGEEIQSPLGGKMAIIDSGNTSI